jgi:hypothetical protein
MLDSCVIGNLLNFPKHIFGFPFACHGTDGNESLSLTLFSYRQLCQARLRSTAASSAAPSSSVSSSASPAPASSSSSSSSASSPASPALPRPVVLYVRNEASGGDGGERTAAGSEAAMGDLRLCSERLGMRFVEISHKDM